MTEEQKILKLRAICALVGLAEEHLTDDQIKTMAQASAGPNEFFELVNATQPGGPKVQRCQPAFEVIVVETKFPTGDPSRN